MPTPRFVIFHTPGPTWEDEKTVMEQTGVAAHFAYLQNIAARGLIELAGPFITGPGGGMLVLRDTVDQQTTDKIAAEDPAVQSGLITANVRTWLVTLPDGAPQ